MSLILILKTKKIEEIYSEVITLTIDYPAQLINFIIQNIHDGGALGGHESVSHECGDHGGCES